MSEPIAWTGVIHMEPSIKRADVVKTLAKHIMEAQKRATFGKESEQERNEGRLTKAWAIAESLGVFDEVNEVLNDAK